MALQTVESSLGAFSESDVSVKLVRSVLSVIPGAPALPYYRTLQEAQAASFPDLPPGSLARAASYAAEPGSVRALEVADYIDRGDVGIAAFSGAAAAFKFFFGNRAKALDTDPEQGADAALKALALAYLIHQLIPGTVAEKVALLRSTPAGEALLIWFAAVEIALPFSDDALLAGGSVVGSLIERYGGGHVAKLDTIAGAGAGASATAMLGGLASPLDKVIANVSGYTNTIADKAKQYLPSAIASAGTVAGAVATGADALPVYRLLVGRLVAEAALARCRV
jgi:hypothetical protein